MIKSSLGNRKVKRLMITCCFLVVLTQHHCFKYVRIFNELKLFIKNDTSTATNNIGRKIAEGTLSIKEYCKPCYLCFALFFPPSFLIDTQAFSRSYRKQSKRDKYHEAPASFLDQTSNQKLIVEGGSSLKDNSLSKDTLKSKEIQAQRILKLKKSVSDYGYHGNSLLKAALDENDIHRNDHFPKGKWCPQVLVCSFEC